MRRCAFQFFFGAVFLALVSSLRADLTVGKEYAFGFVDIDGNKLSTADGHVSIVVLITRQNLSKSELVGDRVPDFCLGSPKYRMITVVKFGKHSVPVRAFLLAGARFRFNNEAKRVQPRYDAKKIARSPRQDIFAVADFDGSIAQQLGAGPEVSFRVFVFGRNGELLGQWNDVPSTSALEAVLK